jgi:putative molybdopterin biosynthesis protein
VHRPDDPRFAATSVAQAIAAAKSDPACLMVNRNQGSGTRILIDQLLKGAQPQGYAVQSRSHNAVAAAVAQRRADWGVAIEIVAKQCGLGFLPLTLEQYDFVVPRSRSSREAVQAFRDVLAESPTRDHLRSLGFVLE